MGHLTTIISIVFVVGCSFSGRGTESPRDAAVDGDVDGAVDAPIDSPDMALPDAFEIYTDTLPSPTCPADSHLRLCFSFDAAMIPTPMVNEGAATLSADTANVTRAAYGAGGIAQVGTTSKIFVPGTTPAMTMIATAEMWIRVGVDPAPNARSGLFDANIAPALALFYHAYETPPSRRIRCALGAADDFYTTVDLPPAPTPWLYIACTCANGRESMYVNGDLVATLDVACGAGGGFSTDGLAIGANNAGGGGVNEGLVGAIDGIRLWDQALSSSTICANAGRTTCAQ